MNEQSSSQSAGDDDAIGHVVSPGVLLAVFAVLIALTFATVAATWVDLGDWNLVLALGIATVKAMLVAAYFMHLRYDNPLYALIFATALLFLALFLALTLLDTIEYQGSIDSYQEANPP